MTGWTSSVEEPFQHDPDFWTSVGRSSDAFWTLVVATVLVVALGRLAFAAFVVPAALIVLSGRHARASTARTRPLFETRAQWREAERRAVAAAIPGGLVRHLRRS